MEVLFVHLSVCLSSLLILFLQTLSSRNLSHGNISQFKFRIRTDYFGLVGLLFEVVLGISWAPYHHNWQIKVKKVAKKDFVE